ncbi:hypothetical protein [Limnoglobus roseus]|uniref:Uncharacterized protein n=1 Tax=Limnoglobus roseus TaxID=2598579 RepID=A0A5C1AEE9_9BACT|nr:hypothetical protein [Limnoglobus roseus]QEL17100.1 hypothetical protein PX52LOC_04077 [Limnoglobus roseus]
MGELAAYWKEAKDRAENNHKIIIKSKPSSASLKMPVFKSDFQKTLDVFEAAVKKLEEDKKAALKAAEACKLIIKEYTELLKTSEIKFMGDDGKDKILKVYGQALVKLNTDVEERSPK